MLPLRPLMTTSVPHSMLGRYLYQEGSSDKFWDCLEESAGTYLIRWGRRGTRGQEKRGNTSGKAYASIQEKTRKGYQKDHSYTITSEREELDQSIQAIPIHPNPGPRRL